MKKIVFKVLCIFLILFQGCKAGKRGLLDGTGQLSDNTEQTVHEQKSESDEVIENEYIKVTYFDLLFRKLLYSIG